MYFLIVWEFCQLSDCSLTVQAETTVIGQCTQLLSPSADPKYATTYITHSFPEHRNCLCAGAWILMHGHPENINSANLVQISHFPLNYLNSIYATATSFLGSLFLSPLHKKLLYNILKNNNFFSWNGDQARVLREFSPEEVTANIYTMVDVLLHHIQMELQHGHPIQVYSFCQGFLLNFYL